AAVSRGRHRARSARVLDRDRDRRRGRRQEGQRALRSDQDRARRQGRVLCGLHQLRGLRPRGDLCRWPAVSAAALSALAPGRAPELRAEPIQVRDSFFVPIAATWELLAPAAELTDQGTVQVAGRGGKKIAVKLSPNPAKPPAETLSQREWREKRSIEAVSGE